MMLTVSESEKAYHELYEAFGVFETIEKELALIHSEQFEYFFLTIYDIVQFAKSRGILYQGRGSAANSIVCYCLEITAVDPRQINVLSESVAISSLDVCKVVGAAV